MSPDPTEVVYPPELGAEVSCANCDGQGAREAIAGHCFDIDGGLWHLPGECTAPEHRGSRTCCPPCTWCHGKGRVARKHYAYCKRAACIGCLPTQAELKRNPNILDLWAEMLAWCIPQSPNTKTREGALAALAAGRAEYESVAYFARRYNLVIAAIRPMLDGCAHDYDPECARCEMLTPVREAVAEADTR